MIIDLTNLNELGKDVQLEAVKEDGYSVKFIKNPDKEVQLEAVKEDGYSIQFIRTSDREGVLVSVVADE